MPLCAAMHDTEHELWFGSLFHDGRGYAFPCDPAGRVDLDALPRSALVNYLYVRSLIGRDVAAPVVRPRQERA